MNRKRKTVYDQKPCRINPNRYLPLYVPPLWIEDWAIENVVVAAAGAVRVVLSTHSVVVELVLPIHELVGSLERRLAIVTTPPLSSSSTSTTTMLMDR